LQSLFGRFFEYVKKPTFDIAADAFSTFKDLLSVHKIICADFLESKYEYVFTNYNDLLQSDNYVRPSLLVLFCSQDGARVLKAESIHHERKT
jgi:hypothetical protein